MFSDRLSTNLNPQRSLKARLGMAVAAIVLLLSTVLSLLVGGTASIELTRTIEQSLGETAYQMADKLDRGMFERYRDIQILAALDPIRQPDYPINTKRTLIQELQNTYPDYAWIGLLDPQGLVLASTGRVLEGKNIAHRPVFHQAKNKTYVGDLHDALLLGKILSHRANEPLRLVDVSAPVLDKQGKLQNVIAAHLNWIWAREIQKSLLEPTEKHDKLEIFILDRHGKVLLAPPQASEKQFNVPKERAASYKIAGYLTGFARSQGYRKYPGLGWTVLVRQKENIALAPARLLQQQVFGWGIGLGIVFAICSWLSASQIVEPMLKLTAVANQIRQGDRSVKIPIFAGRDELATLAGSLSHLVYTLDRQQQELTFANSQLQSELIKQQQAEQKIREQADLLDVATDAIFVRNLENYQILFWNRGAERMYGWTAAEAVGQNADYLLYDEDNLDQIAAALTTTINCGAWQGELTKVTKAGKELIVSSRWTLARDRRGKAQFILTVDTDITEQKQLAAQFLRAQRLESLGTLAGGIAHDMNNILTPIIMTAQLLRLKYPNFDDRTQRHISILEESAKRGSDLVKQILAFARGGVEGSRSSLQVAHILAEIRRIIKSTFPKSIEIYCDIPQQELWTVSADATQLHQVFMNLCVNARDAMPEGGTLSLVAENVEIDENYAQMCLDAKVGAYVMFSITDTGMGIAPEVLERMFEPFFTTKEIGKGTGLGLSTSIGIIKSHDGFINVYSELGAGSQFKVYLPAEQKTVVQQAEEVELLPGHGELILVVDDEATILEIVKNSLSAYNYTVITANNGSEAIATYTKYQGKIQAVLLDLMMPGISSLTAISTLHQIDPLARIIATSGLAANEMAISSHIQGFLLKPYTMPNLLTTLNKVLVD